MDATQPKPLATNVAPDHPALRLAGSSVPILEAKPRRRETVRLLSEARALLTLLKVDRSRVEARLVEFGRTDPIAEVKGKSALDAAVESCQAAIEQLDRMAGLIGAESPAPRDP